MRRLLVAAMLAAIVSPAFGGERYDHRLEEQVKRIVAAKIGEIRGTISYERIMVFPAVERVGGGPSFQTLPSLPATGRPHFQMIE